MSNKDILHNVLKLPPDAVGIIIKNVFWFTTSLESKDVFIVSFIVFTG